MGVSVFFIILMLAFNLRNGTAKAWAVQVTETPSAPHVPVYSYIVPLVPVIAAFGFNWGPVPGMFMAIFLSLLLTGQLRNWQNAQSLTLKALRDGVADVALLLGMLFTLAMFLGSCRKKMPKLSRLYLDRLFRAIPGLLPLFLALRRLSACSGDRSCLGAQAVQLLQYWLRWVFSSQPFCCLSSWLLV